LTIHIWSQNVIGWVYRQVCWLYLSSMPSLIFTTFFYILPFPIYFSIQWNFQNMILFLDYAANKVVLYIILYIFTYIYHTLKIRCNFLEHYGVKHFHIYNIIRSINNNLIHTIMSFFELSCTLNLYRMDILKYFGYDVPWCRYWTCYINFLWDHHKYPSQTNRSM
jgi:hypothetical protein